MNKEFKAHPLMMLTLIKPFLFVLVLPFLKALLKYFFEDHFANILIVELRILFFLIIISFIRYKSYKILVSDDTITVKRGVVFRQSAEIKLSKLSSVQVRRNLLDMLCGSVMISINTEAGAVNSSDFKMKMSLNDCRKLTDYLYTDIEVSKVRFSALRVAIFAAATSSAFSGIIIGIPILNRAGKLLGVALSDVLDELNTVSARIETYFPPAVNTISLILLLCYVISFAYSFFKYMNFKLLLNDNKLEVHTGLFVRVKTAFKKASVNNVMIIQTPLMMLFRRYSMKASVGGFGEAKSESQIIVPAGTHKEIKTDFVEYFPFLVPDGESLRPRRTLLMKSRFLYWPSVYLILVLAASITSTLLFKDFTRFIFFITLVLLFMVFYYAYISLFEFKYGKIKFGDNVMAKSTKGFRTCRLYCPKEKIGEIKITRILMDFVYKTCRVRITVCSEGADTIRVRHLNYTEVIREIYRNFDIVE